MMLQCWDTEPQSRPTFSEIVVSLSQSLEAMADYLDIGTFGNECEHDLIDGCGADQPREVEVMVKGDEQEKSGEAQALMEDDDNKETAF